MMPYDVHEADLSILDGFSDEYDINEKEYVATAVEYGLIHGYDDSTLRPNQPVSRAEAAALLYNALY